MGIKTSYCDMLITVPKEVADFLAEDRKRQEAERKRSSRHLCDINFDVVLNTYIGETLDPVFDEVSRNLDMENLREAVAGLTPDERILISLRFYKDLTLEEIGRQYGVTKMAISKRLNKLYAKLRASLMGGSQLFSILWFTNCFLVSYLLRASVTATMPSPHLSSVKLLQQLRLRLVGDR